MFKEHFEGGEHPIKENIGNADETRKPSLEQALADELKEALKKSEEMDGSDDEKKSWLNREVSRIILSGEYQGERVSRSRPEKLLNPLFDLTEEAESIVTYQKYKETLGQIIEDTETLLQEAQRKEQLKQEKKEQKMSQEELLEVLEQIQDKGVSAEDIRTALSTIENSKNEKSAEAVEDTQEVPPEVWFVRELEEVLEQGEKWKNDERKGKQELNLRIITLVDYNMNKLPMPGNAEEKRQTLVDIHLLSHDAFKDSISFAEYKAKLMKIIKKNKMMLERDNNTEEEYGDMVVS